MYIIIPTFIISQLLPILLISESLFKSVISFLFRLYEAADTLVKPSIHVFLENYEQPFPARSIDLTSVHSATPTLAYNADTYVFFPYNNDLTYTHMLTDHKLQTLPILSLEIVGPDSSVAFDLTDFVEKLRYVDISGADCPEIFEVFSAWAIMSRVVLDKDVYTARLIKNDGKTYTTSLYSFDIYEEESDEEENVIIEDISGQAIESDDISIEELN